MKKLIIVILIVIVVGGVIWFLSSRTPEESTSPEEEITSFEECVLAGYTILESYPRQCQTPEGETFIEEIEIEDETADWQTYSNKEYGFEIKYPPKIEEDRISVIRENTISLSYYCPPLPEPLIYNNFQIEIADNSAQLPIKTWIQQNELCGLQEETFVDVTISGAQGVSVKGAGGCSPGGYALNRKVYLIRDSEVYTIAFYHELGESEECAKEAEDFFAQMLSTFRFIEEDETAEGQACIDSGGTVKTGMCCLAVSDFPNLCLIGACGCSPENSHEVKTCDCGDGKCFNGETCVSE